MMAEMLLKIMAILVAMLFKNIKDAKRCQKMPKYAKRCLTIPKVAKKMTKFYVDDVDAVLPPSVMVFSFSQLVV